MNSKNFIIKQMKAKAEFITDNTDPLYLPDVDVTKADARELAQMVIKYLSVWHNHG